MAAALLSGCDCHSDVAISCCDVGLWNDSRLDRAQRIWIESAEPTACDTRAYRHAARARDFSDRLGDLAKNPIRNWVGIARPSLHLRIAHCRNVDQGPDCLCVSAAGNRDQCCSRCPVGDTRASHSEAATGLARLVAMDRFAGSLPLLGDRRDFVYAWLL